MENLNYIIFLLNYFVTPITCLAFKTLAFILREFTKILVLLITHTGLKQIWALLDRKFTNN